MKIHWGRVLNAGLIAEILLLFIYRLIVELHGRGTASNVDYKIIVIEPKSRKEIPDLSRTLGEALRNEIIEKEEKSKNTNSTTQQ